MGTSSIAYIIGDDVLAQATGTTATSIDYLLYDGHGSTRQLAEFDSTVSIADTYSYDGYGVLLQDEAVASQRPGHVSSQATSLLYAGDHFDTDSQSYYLRARWYDSLSGRFNRMDPFPGNNQDPQSLHKYLYAHCNPINGADPTGMFTNYNIGGLAMSIAVYSTLALIGAYVLWSRVGPRSFAQWGSIYPYLARWLGQGKIRSYRDEYLDKIIKAKTYKDADLHAIFDAYIHIYPTVTTRACHTAIDDLLNYMKTYIEVSVDSEGIDFKAGALFFIHRETSRPAREMDNILILVPEDYISEKNQFGNKSWYNEGDDKEKKRKKNIIFFYPGSAPLKPVGNLYEAVVNDSWRWGNYKYDNIEVY